MNASLLGRTGGVSVRQVTHSRNERISAERSMSSAAAARAASSCSGWGIPRTPISGCWCTEPPKVVFPFPFNRLTTVIAWRLTANLTTERITMAPPPEVTERFTMDRAVALQWVTRSMIATDELGGTPYPGQEDPVMLVIADCSHPVTGNRYQDNGTCPHCLAATRWADIEMLDLGVGYEPRCQDPEDTGTYDLVYKAYQNGIIKDALNTDPRAASSPIEFVIISTNEDINYQWALTVDQLNLVTPWEDIRYLGDLEHLTGAEAAVAVLEEAVDAANDLYAGLSAWAQDWAARAAANEALAALGSASPSLPAVHEVATLIDSNRPGDLTQAVGILQAAGYEILTQAAGPLVDILAADGDTIIAVNVRPAPALTPGSGFNHAHLPADPYAMHYTAANWAALYRPGRFHSTRVDAIYVTAGRLGGRNYEYHTQIG